MNKPLPAFIAGAAAALAVVFTVRVVTRDRGATKAGPIVARVGGEAITADEIRQRLNETSPFLRARYTTLERKKEFLDNLIKNELLAQEAQRQGLDKSPQVREQAKRAMIQELIHKQLDEKVTGADIAEPELRKYYQAHLDDYVKPERARVFHLFLPARDAKEKAEAKKKAQALLKEIDRREKKGESNAFQLVAQKESRDPQTAPLGGDLRFQSHDELAKAYNVQLADAAFALKVPGENSGAVETPSGIELLKLQVKTVALSRSFEESKEAIRGRMARERRSRDYDDWIRRLRDAAKVTVDDAELDRVQIGGAAPGPAPIGMPGQPAAPASGPGKPAPIPQSQSNFAGK